jgi:hypothetical protein
MAVSFSLVPATLWAGERASPTSRDRPTPLLASVRRAAALESHRLQQPQRGDVTRNAEGQSQTSSSGASELQSGSFFRTPVGLAVLAAFGVGVGYALYSSSNDRIRSSGR